MNKAINHFILITKHKWYVLKNCIKAGIIWRGIKHDLSKYSPTEFLESIKYFVGNDSPINVCKRENGWSKAWLHHKGRNTHHYEYWQDNFDKGGQPLEMPYKDALEMVCDYIAAGQAYMKNGFTYDAEYDWWKGKCKNPLAMHSNTKRFIDLMLGTMAQEGNNDCLRKKRSQFYYSLAKGLEAVL